VSGPQAAPPPGVYVPASAPYVAVQPPPPARAPSDPDQRGGGEMVELYIMGSMLGALTGGYIPFVASDDQAGLVTYTLSLIGGAGLFAVGVATLDLAGVLRTGIPPTISSSIRFGFANGMLAYGLAAADGVRDPHTYFTLVWGGAAAGALVGLGVGFGVQPRVPEQRLVESVGIWGGGLGTSIALMTEYQDPTAALALSLVGLDAGILAGIAAVAGGGRMSIGRTLFLDLGFIGGWGLGIGLPLAYYFVSRDTPELAVLGVGTAIGSVGGWLLLFLLTDGMGSDEADEELSLNVGLSPIEGGAALSFSGAF